jgi:hypothetical protein
MSSPTATLSPLLSSLLEQGGTLGHEYLDEVELTIHSPVERSPGKGDVVLRVGQDRHLSETGGIVWDAAVVRESISRVIRMEGRKNSERQCRVFCQEGRGRRIRPASWSWAQERGLWD